MTNSSSEQEKIPTSINWTLWFLWVLATTLGWIVGWTFIGESGVGIAIGIAQWLVLRRLGPEAGWWMLATAVGWTVGWALIVTGVVVPPGGGIISSLLSGLVFGATTGIAQWIILRRFVAFAGVWILVSMVGWSVGLTGLLGGGVVGTIAGAITGLALEWLVREAEIDL